MSVKIVIFGESEQVDKFLEKSLGGQPISNQDEAISVENVTRGESPYLLFAVRERALVSEQATGTNGLLFFLGGQTPLFQEKQYLIDLLASRVEFQGVPVAVLFERGQQLTLKDVVNYMELYRLKQRASMIKEISWSETDWIDEVYGWVKVQAEQGKNRGFQAAPKVVKLKSKYRESVEQKSQKKYEGLLDERQLRALGVKQQQEVYIEREKERLKQDNMEKQLSNFNRNKKKMAPYDIKPTPNPKIDPNLHFFLKDPNAQPPPQASIKIQTDEFKEKTPPPAYKPKKTGINTATQIEQDELFNFDKEVKPILSILTTKAIENAALQIEEQEELLKMAKYKTAYEERVKKQKEHQKKNIDEQRRVMKEKDKLLQQQRQRADAKRNIQQRTQSYQLANNFLKNIYFQAVDKLVTANAYPDSLSNFINTEYLDQIMGKSGVIYNKLLEEESSVKGVFDQDIVTGLKEGINAPRAEREIAKKRLQARQTNKTGTKRRIHILYKHGHDQFSNFGKHMSKYFDNNLEEHIKAREEQIQQCSDKVQGGQATEDELHRLKLKDSIDFAAAGHSAFLLGNQKELCFTWTSNRYEKTSQNYISNGLLFMDKEGQILQELNFSKILPSQQTYLRRESGLREARETVNMDEGIVINLAKIPDNIKTVLLISRFTDIQKLRVEAEAKKAKYAAYGMQFWERKVGIHQRNIGESIKWEEVVKVVEGEEPPAQNLLIVSYVLRRRVIPQFWNLQDVAYISQPIKNEEESNHLLEELSRFYFRSNQYLKEEEEEERTERPISSQEKKSNQGPRSKSKKLIEEPKKKTVLKVTTKILNEVEVDLNSGLNLANNQFSARVDEWKQFLQICQNGWQLWIKGKKLTDIQQLGKYRKVGDLLLKRVPKVEEPKIQKVEQGDVQKQDQQE